MSTPHEVDGVPSEASQKAARPDEAEVLPKLVAAPDTASPPSASLQSPTLPLHWAKRIFEKAQEHEERRRAHGAHDQTTLPETRSTQPSVRSSLADPTGTSSAVPSGTSSALPARPTSALPAASRQLPQQRRRRFGRSVRKAPPVLVEVEQGRTCRIHPNTDAHESHRQKMYECRSDQSIAFNAIILILLGVSGAGKSTLLLALADTLREGTFEKPKLIFNITKADGSPVFPAALLEPGAPASNGENGDQRRSQTPWPVLYFLGTRDGRDVWALDTAGFLDTGELDAAMAARRLPEAEAADFARRPTRLGEALDAIAGLPHFTSVVAVHAGNTAGRRHPEQEAVLHTFCQTLPDDAKREAALLVLTRSNCCADVGQLPQAIADQTGIQFKTSVFCNNMRFSQDGATAEALASEFPRLHYNHAKDELRRLLATAATLPAFSVDSFKTLGYLRMVVLPAAEELLSCAHENASVMQQLRFLQKTIHKSEDRMKQFEEMELVVLEEVATPGQWHTYCIAHGSVAAWDASTPDKLPAPCHKNCLCTFTPTANGDFFSTNCTAFRHATTESMTWHEMRKHIPQWDGVTDVEGNKYDEAEAQRLQWLSMRRAPTCQRGACKEEGCTSEVHVHKGTVFQLVKKKIPAAVNGVRKAAATVDDWQKQAAELEAVQANVERRMAAAELKFEKIATECRQVNKDFSLDSELAPFSMKLKIRRDEASLAVLEVLNAIVERSSSSSV